MNDLEDVALNALDRQEQLEQQQSDDNQENVVESAENVPDEQNDENGINTNDESENASDDELDGNNDDSEDEEPEQEGVENKKTDKKEEKKELTDEEFEELAKKRGYSKKDDEKKSENDKAAFDKVTKRPREVDKDTWESMPTINKVIYNNLPYIQAIGKDGNVIKVKTAQQLPDDFEFANKKAELQFQNDLQAQEMKAQKMSDAINERISQNYKQQQSTNEARAILGEIETLQNNGDLPKPKAKPGTKEFDEDEAVIFINKVLGVRQQRIKAGYNISVEDALMIFKAKNPDEFKSKNTAKGDAERKKIANKISGNNKAADTSVTSKKASAPKYYKFGMSTEDILDRALDEMDD